MPAWLRGNPVRACRFDLALTAHEVAAQALELWRTPGVMDARHDTPFGVLPGSVVVDFAIIDAAHDWDLSVSVGRAFEFPAEIPTMADVVALTCTDHTVELRPVKPPTEPPALSSTRRACPSAKREARPLGETQVVRACGHRFGACRQLISR